ncbi:MAG: NADH-quinone oxidoreductase subunit L, partial [Bryobacteraceae bacterium]
VGLCSYLLIGFYFQEKYATDAGNKAFIVNRIGDYGFSLAVFLIAIHFGSLDFGKIISQVHGMPVEATPGWITAISLLLLLGATGKSAQIPLYVWLPDAMAGPTPVSALIHAATMVTAGVYMIVRSSQLFLHSAFALDIVALIGLATAFFAATIGLLQNDIKKVFAYSTVSQLGYMFLALGTGAFSAGIFHLMTHAFFKALLFLGAGSVIHALSGEQDLRNMGGLAKKIPITCVTLLCSSLAISGVPGTSGYFSKDMILEAAYTHAPWMFWVGAITAGMTAFYVFRAFFLCFFGDCRGHHHPHEAPAVMWIPLAVLAALSLGGGFINIPKFLDPMFPLAEGGVPSWVQSAAIAFGLGGIALAYLFYVVAPAIPESLANGFSWLHAAIYNKYFVDEFYDATVVRPVVDGSRTLLWRGVDAGVIDGAVNGIGRTARGIGGVLKLAQSGYIRSYAAWVVAGSIIVIVAMALAGGAR